MTTTTLFGLALAPLYAAIAQVESENGRTSDNVYQLSVLYVHEVNRITNGRYDFRESDRYVRWIAEKMMLECWKHYGERYRHQTCYAPDYEVLARIHNGGPDWWRNPATLRYWRKVEAAMDAQEGPGE